MHSSLVTSNGRMTLPNIIREALGIVPGYRVQCVVHDNREVRVMPVRPLSQLFGICQYEGTPISLEDMKRTVEDGATFD